MRLKSYLLQNMPFTKIWNEYSNPFYIWWKCRKYFRFPKCHLYIGKLTWFFGLPIRKDIYNKILDIRCSAVGWKSKYERCDFEWNPYIAITFFRKWQIIWIFNYITNPDYRADDSARNTATWEAMLDMVYNNKRLQEVYERHQWLANDHRITILPNLTNKSVKEL